MNKLYFIRPMIFYFFVNSCKKKCWNVWETKQTITKYAVKEGGNDSNENMTISLI